MLRRRAAYCVILAVLSAAACTRRRPAPPVSPPVSRPGVEEVGSASWYGPGLHGGRTASGERFDKNDLTAASRTFPLGSKVRVTNLANGRSVVVRINDRGPFTRRRIIDVSHAAAKVLGMVERGTATVRVEALGDGKPIVERARRTRERRR